MEAEYGPRRYGCGAFQRLLKRTFRVRNDARIVGKCHPAARCLQIRQRLKFEKEMDLFALLKVSDGLVVVICTTITDALRSSIRKLTRAVGQGEDL